MLEISSQNASALQLNTSLYSHSANTQLIDVSIPSWGFRTHCRTEQDCGSLDRSSKAASWYRFL